MPDPTNEWKEALIQGTDRAVEVVLGERAYHLDQATGDQGDYFGRLSGETEYVQFATGYDSGSGLTTFVFRLDLSTLDGPDRLG